MRRDMRSGANISVSDEATATTSGLSRHSVTYESQAKRTPGSTRRQLATSSGSRPTASASFSQSARPPVPGASPSWSWMRWIQARRNAGSSDRDRMTASLIGMRVW